VTGADPASVDDDGNVLVFHAGTRRHTDGTYRSTGGRVLTVVGRGEDLATARTAAYGGVSEVGLDGAQIRDDIAARELEVLDRDDLDGEPR
jgi:phosphoribosylamine--glycine ligase